MKRRSRVLTLLLALAVFSCTPVASPPPQAQTVSTPTHFDLDELEQSVHNLINQERKSAQLNPLAWNEPLASLAQAHSVDMLENGYFAHNSLDGKTPTDRANEAGFECSVFSEGRQRTGIGENILTASTYHSIEVTELNGVETSRYNWKTQDELADEIVTTWMNSRGHRLNILRSDYTQQGLGAVTGSEQRIYITQNFC